MKVFCSDVTLEYDLAQAGQNNPTTLTDIWAQCFLGTPQTLNKGILAALGSDHKAQTLALWRGICRADHAGSKAEFAHLLADWLAQNQEEDGQPLKFPIPEYIIASIKYVTSANVSLVPIRNET